MNLVLWFVESEAMSERLHSPLKRIYRVMLADAGTARTVSLAACKYFQGVYPIAQILA